MSPTPKKAFASAESPSPHPNTSPASDILISPTGRVTLRDIAQKIGVSHATVCLALRDNPRISKARCIQIKEMAIHLGYQPDPMLTALSHYRRSSGTQPVRSSLAWLSFWENPEDMHTYAELHNYWLGAKDVAEKYGYRIEVFTPSPRYTLSRIQRVLQTRSVSGVLIGPPQGGYPMRLDDFDWRLFPTVKFGYSISGLSVHVVTSAQVSNAMLAYRKARSLGYTRIAFVTSESSIARTQFPAGYLRAQLDSPPTDRLPILGLADDEIDDETTLSAWIRQHRPDAILTNLSRTRRLLDAIGIRVPHDLGLAGFSIHDGLVNTGIDQNPLEIGRAATETLISLINHNTRGIPAFQREVLIEGTWIDGDSLPPRTETLRKKRPSSRAVPAVG